LHLFKAGGTTGLKPTMVLFHGGSWSEGKPGWFFPLGDSLSREVWVVVAVEYRTYWRHGTLPFEAVKDAKSAVRWLRKNAKEQGIDPNKIIALGNSAGGHLALCTAVADIPNDLQDDMQISPVPNALILPAAVYDLTDTNTAWVRRGLENEEEIKTISPLHLSLENLPPTLLFHVTGDKNVPFSSAESLVHLVSPSSLEVHYLPDAGHFIWFDPKYSQHMRTIRTEFLRRLGYK
jgi:acetyl esterase/lipase